jgi:hypothetical protein
MYCATPCEYQNSVCSNCRPDLISGPSVVDRLRQMKVLPSMREWFERNVVAQAERLEDLIEDRAHEIMLEWPGLSYCEAVSDARGEIKRALKKRPRRQAVHA